MALYSLDNVPVHQNTSVRYERPVENTFNRNCVTFIMSILNNVAMDRYIFMPQAYLCDLPFSRERNIPFL